MQLKEEKRDLFSVNNEKDMWYACCVMSGKIDKLAEQRNVNEDLEELKKEKELGNYQEKNNGEDCKRISEQP